MHRIIPIVLLLAACAETPISEEPDVATANAPVDLAFCQGEALAEFVGQPVSTVQADLPERSRVLGPDDIATQDYRIDRLNVFVNGSGTILRLACG